MIGYTFLALSIIVAMIWIFNKPLVETKLPVAKGKLPDVTLKTTTFAFVTLVLHVMTGVLSFLWMLADIVDRCAEEDDPIFQKAGINVIRPFASVSRFDHNGD